MRAPAACIGLAVGRDTIRYFLYLNGRWRWRPTKTMRAHGFGLVTMGRGGPGRDSDGNPEPSVEDKKRAIELNRSWDQVRAGHAKAPARTTLKAYPPGSVGDGYQRAMGLRKAERLAKGVVWTKEQESRDDWPRAWRWLGPEFGDCDPKTVIPEHFLRIDPVTSEPAGLVPRIEREVSITERHRAIKVWRALWKRMRGMGGYCDGRDDPAKAFANGAPDPRQAIWLRREVLKLVQTAWRYKFYGLAALMAVAWDTMLSPIDARSLSGGQAANDAHGMLFFLDRAKSGRAAAGTLSKWSQTILLAYLAKQFNGAELLEQTPLFWTRGGRPVSRTGTGTWGGDHGGGKHVKPRPYTRSSLNQDFAEIRALAFGEDEKRQLQDMRRSGGVEGDAGGASVEDQANKMANSIDANKRLRKTYNPVNTASVRRFDEARVAGAKVLKQRPDNGATPSGLVILQNAAKATDGRSN
jgi:hypothetical protein